MRSAYSSSTPIPLSVHVNRQKRPSRSASKAHARRLVAAELDRVGDQVLEHGGQQPRVAGDGGQPVGDDLAPGVLEHGGEPRLRLVDQLRRLDALVRRGVPADAGELEQVVDQLLHPLGAVDRERDVAVGALVELPLVAALEHLREAGDLAQRLLQVVRRDVGELLELLVGALELARLREQRRLGVAQRGDLGDDPLAHRLDVVAQLGDLARARRLDHALEVAARDRAHRSARAGRSGRRRPAAARGRRRPARRGSAGPRRRTSRSRGPRSRRARRARRRGRSAARAARRRARRGPRRSAPCRAARRAGRSRRPRRRSPARRTRCARRRRPGAPPRRRRAPPRARRGRRRGRGRAGRPSPPRDRAGRARGTCRRPTARTRARRSPR